MEFDQVNDFLKKVVLILIDKDWHLLENDVHERSISHMLACHMMPYFDQLNVDCEYDSNVEADKGKKYIYLLQEKIEELGLLRDNEFSEEEILQRFVYPDIIVHRRGDNENNLLILEMKKSSSKKDFEYDREKLRRFTSPDYENELNYAWGAFVHIGVRKETGDYDIEWYQNGEKLD